MADVCRMLAEKYAIPPNARAEFVQEITISSPRKTKRVRMYRIYIDGIYIGNRFVAADVAEAFERCFGAAGGAGARGGAGGGRGRR